MPHKEGKENLGVVGPENSVHRRKAGFRSKEGRILESGYAYRVAAIKGQNIKGEIGG